MHAAISDYLESVENGKVRACRDQKAVCALVRRVFETEDVRVDNERLEKYLSLQKYFGMQLYPWEKFVLALWDCTYRADGFPRFPDVFCMIGRGAGKDGFIAFDAFCCTSPYNPAAAYDVDICAMSEEQAMRPMIDVLDVLENPENSAKLNKYFYHTKELVQGRKNRGIIRGRTNNPKSHDGMRSGKVVFNELHAYENWENVQLFTTGLGKKADPRRGIFTTNGKVADGPLDDYLAQSERILFEGQVDDDFLPMIFRLDSPDEVHDPENWVKANPSLPYNRNLYEETRKEYEAWKIKPEENGSFMLKRMNLRIGGGDLSVTDYENVKATNKPIPNLAGKPCTVGLDYAELSDWAAVNLHFRIGDQRYDINHAWVCAQSKTLPRIRAPWQTWAECGYITVVDDVSIPAGLIADYIADAGRKYNIAGFAMDNFRYPLMAEALSSIGFDARDKERVKLIRTSDIMMVDPVIQELFDRQFLNWGEQPHLRWAVQNTKRVRSSRATGSDTGNFYYAKIEAKSRKTDMFMAFVASMCIENKLGTGVPLSLPPMAAFRL